MTLFVGGPLDGREFDLDIPCDMGATINQPVWDPKVMEGYLLDLDGGKRTVHPDQMPADCIPAAAYGMATYTAEGQWVETRWHCSDPKCERCPVVLEPSSSPGNVAL